MEARLESLEVIAPALAAIPAEERNGALDPYLIWGCLTLFRGYTGLAHEKTGSLDDQPLFFLAETQEQPDFARLEKDCNIEVSDFYQAKEGITSRFFTLRVLLKHLSKLFHAAPGIRLELALPLRFQTQAAAVKKLPSKIPAGKNLIAVIDDGCPALGLQFRDLQNANQTRIHRVWSQGPQKGGAWGSGQTKGVYGHELFDTTINSLLNNSKEEAANYLNELRYPLNPDSSEDEPEIAFATHGSHVFDLAAGSVNPLTDKDDRASGASLMFVQLTKEAVRDSSGGSLGMQVLDGLRYILAHCRSDTGVIVNISYGTQAGPHDGSSLIEKAMDDLMEQRAKNFAIVLGAGNSRSLLAHAAVRLSAGNKPISLRFTLPEADLTDSFIEIWYGSESEGESGLVVSLTSPEGVSGTAAVGQHLVFRGAENRALAAVHHLARVPTGARSLALIALAGRLKDEPQSFAATPGEWEIGLSLAGGPAVNLEVWIERDDLPLRGEGRPMAFDMGQAAVVETNTLSNIATGKLPIVVGGCRASSGLRTDYSSIGPTSNQGKKPDIWGPADESGSLPGLRAGAVSSGQTFRMGGTSVASPVVARALFNALDGRMEQGNAVLNNQWRDEVLPKIVASEEGTALGIVDGSGVDADD